MTDQQLQYTAARAAAERNFEANLRAVRGRQPRLADAVWEVCVDVEWVLARDGSLTARAEGEWWSGCSLPRRTAETVLKKMELRTPVTCFLSPTHAGQVRVTLDRMTASQALIAVVPEMADVRIMLGCESFAEEIAAGRLWIVSGAAWEEELARLFQEAGGLPTPGQFIRTSLVEDEVVQSLIRAAQELFTRENARRAQMVKESFQRPVRPDAVCVIAPTAFRLWDESGCILGEIARHEGWAVANPDDACHASAVALAKAAAGCGVIVAANVGRSDLPAELPGETKVLTWVTRPAVPAPSPRGERDVLLLADERWRDLARAAGWPGDRVTVAGWPVRKTEKAGSGLGLIADTRVITRPELGLSSQKVLWDSIARELAQDPFAAGEEPDDYLSRWMARAGIAPESVDTKMFVRQLIVPAYQKGLARWLIDARIDVKLFGSGWGEMAEFADRFKGEVGDAEGLRAAVESCAALVHAWPERGAHPIDAMGRPVLRRGFKGREIWLAQARRLSRGEGDVADAGGAEISARTILLAAGLA